MDRAKKIGNFARSRWQQSSRLTKACVIGSVTAVAAPFAIIPVLGMAGFTSAGVAAGSLAASMQTATTVSGSIFALCQSAGATGVVATSTSVCVGLLTGTVTGGVAAAVSGSNSGDPNNGGNDGNFGDGGNDGNPGNGGNDGNPGNGGNDGNPRDGGNEPVTMSQNNSGDPNNDGNDENGEDEQAAVEEEDEHSQHDGLDQPVNFARELIIIDRSIAMP